jgi:hypothetical protein
LTPKAPEKATDAPTTARKQELVSRDAFWAVFRDWWVFAGGNADELWVLTRLAQERGDHPASLIFRMVRKCIALGEFDG